MIKRETATRYIEAVRNAAETVNAGDYAFSIVSIEVFGSYLTDKTVLGDLDLMIRFQPRCEDSTAQQELMERRRRIADKAGRNFPTFFDRLCWPNEEVYRALRGSFRGLSLHDAFHEREALLSLGTTFAQIWPVEDASATSTNSNTEQLATVLQPGDQVQWTHVGRSRGAISMSLKQGELVSIEGEEATVKLKSGRHIQITLARLRSPEQPTQLGEFVEAVREANRRRV